MNDEQFERELQEELGKTDVMPTEARVVTESDVPRGPDNNSTANKLCIASVICVGVTHFGSALLRLVTKDTATVAVAGLCLCTMTFIASWVLMIMARVKCKTNIFGKILMWVYIIELVVGVVVIGLLIFLLYSLALSCRGL